MLRSLLFLVLAACTLLHAQAEAPLRLGVIGLTHGHAEGFFRRVLARQDIRIVGISEPTRGIFDQYAQRHKLDASLWHASADELLDKAKPEAVVVYTSTFDHLKAVEAAAKRGIHVMMEKPLAVSVEHARAIQKAAVAGRIHVLVNYETTWYASNKAAYDLVHEGKLGDVRKVVVHDGHSGPKEIGVGPEFLGWLTDPAQNGAGALFDFGCYGVNLMTWLMHNQRPQTVTAVTQRIKPDIYPKVDDEATIVLTYPQAQAIIQASWNWPFSRKDMEVYGKTGYVITEALDGLRIRLAGAKETRERAKPLADPQQDYLTYFAAVVRGRVQPDGLSSLENNLIVTEILDAARRSAQTGKAVTLRQ